MSLRNFFLVKIRLSTYFFVLFGLFLILTFFLKGITFEAGALTLFSINSFLYGFYIGPVLGAQRQRIEDLGRAVRAEANALFAMMLETKELDEKEHDRFKDMFRDYGKSVIRQKKIGAGEEEYETLIAYCLEHHGKNKEFYHKMLVALVDNQKNRSGLAFLLGSRVQTNEWWIMLVLFSVTLGFIASVNFGSLWVMAIVKALMCTGLTMLMINLLKLSSLTHKRAKTIWQPLEKLLATHFYRID